MLLQIVSVILTAGSLSLGTAAAKGENMPFDYFLTQENKNLARDVPLAFHPDDGLTYRKAFEDQYGRRGERLIAWLGDGGGAPNLGIYDASLLGKQPTNETTTTEKTSATTEAEKKVTEAEEEAEEAEERSHHPDDIRILFPTFGEKTSAKSQNGRNIVASGATALRNAWPAVHQGSTRVNPQLGVSDTRTNSDWQSPSTSSIWAKAGKDDTNNFWNNPQKEQIIEQPRAAPEKQEKAEKSEIKWEPPVYPNFWNFPQNEQIKEQPRATPEKQEKSENIEIKWEPPVYPNFWNTPQNEQLKEQPRATPEKQEKAEKIEQIWEPPVYPSMWINPQKEEPKGNTWEQASWTKPEIDGANNQKWESPASPNLWNKPEKVETSNNKWETPSVTSIWNNPEKVETKEKPWENPTWTKTEKEETNNNRWEQSSTSNVWTKPENEKFTDKTASNHLQPSSRDAETTEEKEQKEETKVPERKYVEIDRKKKEFIPTESFLQNAIPQESYQMSPEGVIYKRLYGAIWNHGEKGLQRSFPGFFPPVITNNPWPLLQFDQLPQMAQLQLGALESVSTGLNNGLAPAKVKSLETPNTQSETKFAGPGEPSILVQSYSYRR